MLYGIEGLLMRSPEAAALDVVEPVYERLMELQAPGRHAARRRRDGAEVRTDVLAQALRVGDLLRRRGRLEGDDWRQPPERARRRAADSVREDGGVLFSADHHVTNTWCAMSALQALELSRARPTVPAPLPTPVVWLI